MAKSKKKRKKKKSPAPTAKPRTSARDKAIRRQQIIFGLIGLLIIFSFVLTLLR